MRSKSCSPTAFPQNDQEAEHIPSFNYPSPTRLRNDQERDEVVLRADCQVSLPLVEMDTAGS